MVVGFVEEAVASYLAEDGDITGGTEFIQQGAFTSEVRTDVLDGEIQRSLRVPIEAGY